MLVCKGKSVYRGIAIGKIRVMAKKQQKVLRRKTENIKKELDRFEDALEIAKEQLSELHSKAASEVGEANAAIFEIHQMMLDDDDYLDSVKNIISEQKVNAEYAVAAAADSFALMFSSMDDEYMKERAADVKDISERIINYI